MPDRTLPSPAWQASYMAGAYSPPESFDRVFTPAQRDLVLRGWAPEGAGLGFPDLEEQRAAWAQIEGGS